MADLSPSAQAVLDAYIQGLATKPRNAIVAALRAAADREKLGPEHWEGSQPDDYERGWNAALRRISRIANELDPTL